MTCQAIVAELVGPRAHSIGGGVNLAGHRHPSLGHLLHEHQHLGLATSPLRPVELTHHQLLAEVTSMPQNTTSPSHHRLECARAAANAVGTERHGHHETAAQQDMHSVPQQPPAAGPHVQVEVATRRVANQTGWGARARAHHPPPNFHTSAHR